MIMWRELMKNKQITLMGEIYQIKNVSLPSGVLGRTDFKLKIIQIDVKQHKTLKYNIDDTIYHELAHYFFKYVNIMEDDTMCEMFANFIQNVVIKQCMKK